MPIKDWLYWSSCSVLINPCRERHIAENDSKSISRNNNIGDSKHWRDWWKSRNLVVEEPKAWPCVCCAINCIDEKSTITKIRCFEIIRFIGICSCNHDIKYCITRFNNYCYCWWWGVGWRTKCWVWKFKPVLCKSQSRTSRNLLKYNNYASLFNNNHRVY